MGLCYCDTCKKYFQSLGIARHRAAHRARKENCTITYSRGDTYDHRFGGEGDPAEKKDSDADVKAGQGVD